MLRPRCKSATSRKKREAAKKWESATAVCPLALFLPLPNTAKSSCRKGPTNVSWLRVPVSPISLTEWKWKWWVPGICHKLQNRVMVFFWVSEQMLKILQSWGRRTCSSCLMWLIGVFITFQFQWKLLSEERYLRKSLHRFCCLWLIPPNWNCRWPALLVQQRAKLPASSRLDSCGIVTKHGSYAVIGKLWLSTPSASACQQYLWSSP